MKLIIPTIVVYLCIVSAERIKIHTHSNPSGKEYSFFPLQRKYLELNVNTTRDINILLSNQYALIPPYYEITIGAFGNTLSLMRKDQSNNYLTPHNASMITRNQFQKFWISINDTEESISVGKETGKPFLFLRDPDYIPMSYFGITTGYGSDGDWDFDFNMLATEK